MRAEVEGLLAIFPTTDLGPGLGGEQGFQRGPNLIEASARHRNLVFDRAGARCGRVRWQEPRVDPTKTRRCHCREPFQKLDGSQGSASSRSTISCRASIPSPRARANVILGRGLKPCVTATGTRARRSIRSRQRMMSRWLTKRRSPHLAKRRRTLVALVISGGRAGRSESIAKEGWGYRADSGAGFIPIL